MGDLYDSAALTLKKDEMPQFRHAAFDKAARAVYESGEFSPAMLRDERVRGLIDETNRVLSSALTVSHKTPPELTAALRHNVFIFSGLKTYHSLSEVGLSLTDEEGNTKSFADFHRDVKAIDARYNSNYLYAEYNHAVHSAQMAVKWHDWEKDGDEYDLQYRTAGDERVREAHRQLDGVTLPPGDKFWDRYLPPNGWNCRCNVVQVLRGEYPRSDSDAVTAIGDEYTRDLKAQMFRFNAGKTLTIYPKKHPYYKAPKQVKEVIREISEEEMTRQRIEEMIGELPDNLSAEEKRAIAEHNLEIEKVLKMTKGKRMTVEQADEQSANPKHREEYVLDPQGLYRDRRGNRYSRNPEYKPSDVQYSINCATCAPAYALRLLGFDVKAKGRVAGSGTLNDSVASNRSFEMWKNIDGTAATPTLTLEWMTRKGYKKMTEKRYREFLEESCKEKGVYILTIGWRGGGGHATVLQRFEDGTLSYIEPQAFDSLQGARRSIDELCEKGATTPFYKRGVMRVDNKLFDTDFLSLFDK